MVKLVDLFPDHDSVSSVGTALITYNEVFSFGQQVNQFTFGFVAPLKANYASSRHPTPFHQSI